MTPLEQQFSMTDGQVTSLAGCRNLNVSGDEDTAANSSIVTKLYLTQDEIPGRLDGRHIYRVSPVGGGFTPATGNLMVTQQDQGGSGISGTVKLGTAPQAGAIVLITNGTTSEFEVAGITLTDASGHFSLKMPPGSYRPVPVATGLVCDISAASVTVVSAGNFATSPDAQLSVAARNISGTVREDAPSHPGLPGMMVYGQSTSGRFALVFTDAGGNYTLPAAADACGMGVLELPLALLGMISTGEFTESSSGSVTGFNLDLPRASALIYGRLSTPANSALPYVLVEGEADSVSKLNGYGITDANGDFTLGVATGSWRVNARVPGFLISEKQVTVNSAGTPVLQNLTAFPVTSHLRSQVRDNLNNPLPNVEILAQDYQGTNSMGLTDSSGNFDLGIYGGPAARPSAGRSNSTKAAKLPCNTYQAWSISTSSTAPISTASFIRFIWLPRTCAVM